MEEQKPIRPQKKLKLSQEDEIARYLIENPAFFIRHPEVLDQVQLPHPEKGSISLLEAQQKRLKDQVRQLTMRMHDVNSIASYNANIFRTFFGLYNDLYQCGSVRELVDLLNESCRASLFIPVTHLWINAQKVVDCNSPADSQYLMPIEDFSSVCVDIMKRQKVSMGRLAEHERRLIFTDDDMIYSRALVRMGEYGELGILAFGHTDANHYRDSLDSFFIEQLADYIALLLHRFIRFAQ
ncbi:MAG: DUF484 family protein [Succinivibrionaceae bacterium]|nr:DUF484 family protein [Succinivibrionaceae bacterium]